MRLLFSLPSSVFLIWYVVDENLFYKGVDKRAVHGARLQQHSSSEPGADVPSINSGIESEATEEELPPYPFKSGNSLLALTKEHNVRFFYLWSHSTI